MTAHVEARSLASLNFLAANPPQYPVNPTEERHESLVLYISRVPGTRDVIFSTFKPQVKNVTAEDVANSLYYVHLELAPDAGLVPPAPIRDPDTPRSSLDSSRSASQGQSQGAGAGAQQIKRKPLPPNAKVPSLHKTISDGSNTQNSPPNDGDFSSTALEGDIRRLLDVPPELPPRPVYEDRPDLPPRPAQPSPARRPLGPRPMTDSRILYTEKSLPPDPEFDRGIAWDPELFSPSRSSARDQYLSSSSPARGGDRSPSPMKRTKRDAYVPFSLVLIRRDPGSGHQWNVGRVSSYQFEPPPPPELNNEQNYFLTSDHQPHQYHQYNVRQPPINIRLETSGYAKFRGMPQRHNLDPLTSGSSLSLARSFGGLAGGNPDETPMPSQQPEGGFSRQVLMTYRPSWTSNLKEKFKRPSSSGSPERPRQRHARQQSSLSTGSGDSSGSGGDPSPGTIITQPGHGLKPRGYMFTSPWDGRCEFRTGNAGRSVKCRHVLENISGASNPLVPASQGRHGTAFSGGSAPVSELRFNLPSTDLFKAKDETGHHALHGHFSKLLRKEHVESDSEEDEHVSPFDLHLGRERAGGGNRGKRAKLGKLIIHHEGLKMLDLVVAANVGVWWGAWERSF